MRQIASAARPTSPARSGASLPDRAQHRSGISSFFARFTDSDRRDWACIILAVVTFQVFLPVLAYDFLHYDDPAYVADNAHVTGGLTFGNMLWAFGALHGDVSYWHPLTWMSHQLDCELFGLRPGAHHLTNVLLHIGGGILLFLFLHRATGTLWRSATVAALFCLHPLHVESVAWISERKDVLSGLLWMATLLAYAKYAAKPHLPHYLAVFFLFALALMAKPSVVTLPFVLLLVDFWPLRRWNCGNSLTARWRGNGRLIVEKLPLLCLSALVSVVTVVAQREVGAMIPVQFLPLSERVDNALIAYVLYVWKTLWPFELAVIYSRAGSWPFTAVLAAAGLLSAATWAVIRLRGVAPYLVTGWFWFLGTLVPMIGLVQVGAQFMADRYTYISIVGIFIMFAWGLPHLARDRRIPQRVFIAGACAALLAAVWVTRRQLEHWENSRKLFTHATQVTRNNWVAHQNLALTLANDGKYEEADRQFVEALRILPRAAVVHEERGNVQLKAENLEAALASYKEALRMEPARLVSHLRLAMIYAASPEAALRDEALALKHAEFVGKNSRVADAGHLDVLAVAYAASGRFEDALATAQRALTLAKASGLDTRELEKRMGFYRRGEPYRMELRNLDRVLKASPQ